MDSAFLESLITYLGPDRFPAVFQVLRNGGVEDLPAWLSAQIAGCGPNLILLQKDF